MKAHITSLFFLLILLNFPLSGVTAPISYTYDYGSADIIVNGTSYYGTSLKITATADTAGVYNPLPMYPMLFAVNYDSLELTVGGVGTGSFVDSGYVSAIESAVGFGTSSNGDLAYILGLLISNYDLMSTIGPINGIASHLGQWRDIQTSLGLTTLIDFSSPAATFTATVSPVPEIATMLLLGSGLIGLVGLRRKFKK